MRKIFLFFYLILFSIFGFSQFMHLFSDDIDCRYFPKNSRDTVVDVFSTSGSWFGLGIPSANQTEKFGKFAGPYSFFDNKWISKSLLEFNFGIPGVGKIQYESANDFELVQFPGMLYQKFVFDNFYLEIRAIFISGRTCLFKADAINTSNQRVPMSWMVKGDAFEELGEADKFTDGWMYKIDNMEDVFWLIRFRLDDEMNLVFNPDSFEFSYKNPIWVEPQDTFSIVTTLSQYFKGDLRKDIMLSSEALQDPNVFFERNDNLWNFLVTNVVVQNDDLRNLSLQALQTMFLNLRSYLPTFQNYFFNQNSNQQNEAIYVDENWFYASAMIRYDPNVSIYCLNAVVSNLNIDSSLNQIIPVLGSIDNNSGLSQRPMAAWTAWNAFSAKPKKEIMQRLYPLIKASHQYWYSHQNMNGNLWCEDDNGVERPDINAMLFSEKYCLNKMAQELSFEDDVEIYQQQMDSMKLSYNSHFFDTNLAGLANINISSSSTQLNDEAIAYALWAGLAAFDVADYYANIVRNNIEEGVYKDIFKTGKFDISYYYFLISGLKLYKYEEEANRLRGQLLEVVRNDTKNNIIPSYGLNGKEYNNSTLTASVLLLLMNY
jgi:hypothetical protein